jgi:hypothetical protein
VGAGEADLVTTVCRTLDQEDREMESNAPRDKA